MKRILSFIFLALMVFSVTAMAQAKEKRRGKYLRTDIKKTDKKNDFLMTLENNQLGMPTLKFRKMTILTHHEVRIYEMLIEIVRENGGQGITERGAVEYVLVPDEVYEGEQSIREEIEDNGPLSEAELEADFNGLRWSMHTDKNGVYIDSSQRILEKLDDLRIKKADLIVKHATFGSKSLSITRNLIKRETATMPDVEKQATIDILETFGQDYTQLRQSGTEGLKTSVAAPAKGRAGEIVAITVDVTNNGQKPVSNLLGRSFSSDADLNGKMFYFGNIQPGGKASFTRLVRLPEGSARKSYAAIGFWTILGTAQDAECRFSIDVEAKE